MKNALILIMLLAFAAGVNAQIVTIAIEALVTVVDDDADLLDGAISTGDIITGTYTYNTNTPDTNPLSTVGDYWHSQSPYGVSLSCNDLEFKTDPDNVNFLMEMADNHNVGGGFDKYGLISYQNIPLSGISVEYIEWALIDYSMLALTEIALPSSAPNLTDWTSPSGLNIRSGKTGVNDDQFEITAMVYLVEVVPEPATLLFLTGGALLVRKRKLNS
jgi:hypothetical protein